MQQGIDVFLSDARIYQHLRIAVVTNHASFTAMGIPVAVAMQSKGLNIVKIFSPEHGITAQAEDGQMIASQNDAVTGLPVVSLYGEKLKPAASDLAGVDLVVFDLPNIGCRFYTYLWTMTYMMEACAENNKRLMILDRVNPLGNNLNDAEGPMLDEVHCNSFLGRWSIPIRFQLTYGELANYWNITKNLDLQLEVIPVPYFKRNSINNIDKTFIPASPSMPNLKTALLYPGMGLMEAYNISEGRGTALPFQVLGAPWIDGLQLASALNALKIPGILFYPYQFLPIWGRHAQQYCNGVYMEVTDETIFKPVYNGVMILAVLNDLYPQYFKEETYPTAANPSGKNHLEKLAGSIEIKQMIQQPLNELKEQLTHFLDVENWLQSVQPFILYS